MRGTIENCKLLNCEKSRLTIRARSNLYLQRRKKELNGRKRSVICSLNLNRTIKSIGRKMNMIFVSILNSFLKI